MGKVSGTTNQIDRFRKALSPKTEDGFPPWLPSHGWIFNRPNQHGSQRLPLDIRKRGSEQDGVFKGKPLFAGKLEFSGYYRPLMDEFTSSRLRLHLIANASLFARFSPPLPNGALPFNEPYGSTPPPATNGEFGLDGKDNWIPHGAHDAFYTPPRWRWHLARYLREIRSLMKEDFRTAATLSHVDLEGRQDEPNYSIMRVETYWEFRTENPLVVVQTLRHLLSNFAANSRDTEYFGNALALRYRVRNGVELCIYAKTNQRIRFEVRHDLTKHIPAGVGTRAVGRVSASLNILQNLRTDAAGVVNRALGHVRGRNQIQASHINEALLMVKIGRIVKNDSLAVIIVEMIRARGGISPDNQVPVLANALLKLRNEGVLIWGENHLWIPAPIYQHAARTLQGRADTLLAFPSRRISTAPTSLPNSSPPPPIAASESHVAAKKAERPPRRKKLTESGFRHAFDMD